MAWFEYLSLSYALHCVLRRRVRAIKMAFRQPETATIDSMASQVMGLRRLVDDLYLLSKRILVFTKMETRKLDIASKIDKDGEQF